MASLNKVQIIGNLTRDPESKKLQDGSIVVNFGIATNKKWKDRTTGEDREEVEFHNITAWRNTAEICMKYLRKGKQVFIEGSLKTNTWDDQETGKKMYKTEIIADKMLMLGRKSDDEGAQPSQPAATPAAAPVASQQADALEEDWNN